ncbi:hypothetical protein J7M22_05555 [Candidatus Poribacteria bacterium]|nr:hypothetical protein [Candidatus Poribacteria bacterium]
MRGMEVARKRLAELLLSECGDVPRKNALALGAIVSGSALGALLIPSGARGNFVCESGTGKQIICNENLVPPEICCNYWVGSDVVVCCVQTWGSCPSWEAIDTTPHRCI